MQLVIYSCIVIGTSLETEFASFIFSSPHSTNDQAAFIQRRRPLWIRHIPSSFKKRGVLLLHDLADCLFLDFSRYFCLNPLILLFRNLFAKLSVARVAEQNIGIKESRGCNGNRHNFSKQIIVGPSYRCQEQVKEETPGGTKEESKVDCNHYTKKLKLCFKAAYQQSKQGRINRQNPIRNAWETHHFHNLECIHYERKVMKHEKQWS